MQRLLAVHDYQHGAAYVWVTRVSRDELEDYVGRAFKVFSEEESKSINFAAINPIQEMTFTEFQGLFGKTLEKWKQQGFA